MSIGWGVAWGERVKKRVMGQCISQGFVVPGDIVQGKGETTKCREEGAAEVDKVPFFSIEMCQNRPRLRSQMP